MRPATRNAIKALLRMDATVTEAERSAVVCALADGGAEALARTALDGAWMKGADVCMLLDFNRSTLARWIAAGRIEAEKRGGRWYVQTASVRRYMAG